MRTRNTRGATLENIKIVTVYPSITAFDIIKVQEQDEVINSVAQRSILDGLGELE